MILISIEGLKTSSQKTNKIVQIFIHPISSPCLPNRRLFVHLKSQQTLFSHYRKLYCKSISQIHGSSMFPLTMMQTSPLRLYHRERRKPILTMEKKEKKKKRISQIMNIETSLHTKRSLSYHSHNTEKFLHTQKREQTSQVYSHGNTSLMSITSSLMSS